MPDDIVKQGYVQVKSKHLGTWNKRWLKLRNENSGQAKRLEKYADEAAARSSGSERTTYELNGVHYVGRLSDSKKKHAIRMIMGDSSTDVQFAADSELEAENWLTAIQELKSGVLGSSKKTMFEVYLLKSSALDASGECLLEVRADSICLLDIENPKRVQLSWPLSSIRKYCTERGLFRIETGRSSPTGEGQFMFDCRCADDIYDCVQAATSAMAKAKTQSPVSAAAPGFPSAKQKHEAEMTYHASMKNQNCYDAPPPYIAPVTPAKGHQGSRDYVAPDVKSSIQPTRSAPRSSSGTGSSAYDVERDPYNRPPPIEYTGPKRGKPGNNGLSGESRQQVDGDDAYYPAGQQPTTIVAGPKKNAVKNQMYPANYEKAAPLSASSNTGNWRRDENDVEGEYYTEGPAIPPRRQGITSSSSHVTNQSASNNNRKTASCGTSTSTHVYASVKDEDDKNLEYALKNVFDGTDLHLSRTVDRLELEGQFQRENN